MSNLMMLAVWNVRLALIEILAPLVRSTTATAAFPPLPLMYVVSWAGSAAFTTRSTSNPMLSAEAEFGPADPLTTWASAAFVKCRQPASAIVATRPIHAAAAASRIRARIRRGRTSSRGAMGRHANRRDPPWGAPVAIGVARARLCLVVRGADHSFVPDHTQRTPSLSPDAVQSSVIHLCCLCHMSA